MKTPNCRYSLAIAAILLAPAGCEKAEQTDISTILARHTEARGGAAALEAVQAIEVTRRVQEGKRQLTTHYIATRDGRMRLDIYERGVPVFSEGDDGQSAWQRRGRSEATEEMPAWAATAVKRAVRQNLYALHELPSTGTELVLAGREKTSGLMHWVIEATDPDGYQRRLFINPNDFLIARVQETSALNPDRTNHPSKLNTYFSDYREISGVMFSFRSETFGEDSVEPMQATEATEIVVNPEFDPAIFARPSDDIAEDNDSEDGEGA